MRKVKIILLAACLVIGASMRVFAAGESCFDPIVIGKDYQATISGMETIWFVANTFDLPLAIDYYPSNPDAAGPVLELDFSCTPGVYDDPVLCGLFCSSNSVYIALPYIENPSPSYDKEGKLRYHVEMGEFYRDMLLQQGIDYNVQVYIKATFYSSGTIGISPDPFSTCMDGAKFMHLGDTVRVKAQDAERHVIVPYIQWQNDSIRYVWTGDERVTLAIMGKKCDFDPLDNADENMLQWRRIEPDSTLKMTSADIKHYLDDNTKQKDGGMYYAKFYSNSPGVMKIERVPMTPPEGGATLLTYDKETKINANAFNALYAIPQSWMDATLFSTPTDFIFRMYIGTTPEFDKETAIASYQFDKLPHGHQLGLSDDEMQALWTQATGKYLYVRFECAQTTTVLPTLWAPSPCVTQSTLVKPAESVSIAAKSTANHRLLYSDWAGGDMTIEWKCQTGACPLFIGDSCIRRASEEDPHVFYNDRISKNSTVTIPAADIAAWASHVDGDGYLYAVFNPNNKGTITITTTAPAETDPELPHATIAVACADDDPHTLLVRVSEEQTITVTDGNGSVADEWDAAPAESRTLTLPTGQYTLKGTKEEILLVP